VFLTYLCGHGCPTTGRGLENVIIVTLPEYRYMLYSQKIFYIQGFRSLYRVKRNSLTGTIYCDALVKIQASVYTSPTTLWLWVFRSPSSDVTCEYYWAVSHVLLRVVRMHSARQGSVLLYAHDESCDISLTLDTCNSRTGTAAWEYSLRQPDTNVFQWLEKYLHRNKKWYFRCECRWLMASMDTG
jgi:hypothetical protein